jgi:hypothetical protein
MTALYETFSDRNKWLQQGVVNNRPTRQRDDLTCVVDLPEALGSSEYIPPDGFDVDPVSQSARTLIYFQDLKGCSL